MPQILRDISLKTLNTFGIDVNASYFASVETIESLKDIVKSFRQTNMDSNALPILILGGGSNMLFIDNFPGLVLQNNIRGIHVVEERSNDVLVEAGAGEVWHDFVNYCIQHGYAGVENLSLIPGSVGASPIQNIGAYGVEVKDVIERVKVYDLVENNMKVLTKEDCQFAYRSSIFKTIAKNKYVVVSVIFKLSKFPVLHLEYGAIQNELKTMGVASPDIKNVSDAIIRIRTSKLPDPLVIGNAGSFFKNPVVTENKLNDLKGTFEKIIFNRVENGFKLAAGWLIEKAGWKGYRDGDAGVHEKQALVLVNYGNATGRQIHDLAIKIQASVFDTFGVTLEMEVNVIP